MKALALVAVACLASTVASQPKPSADEIRKRIADLKAEVAKLEKELEAAEPGKMIEWKLGSVGTVVLPDGIIWTTNRVVAPGAVKSIAIPAKGGGARSPFVIFKGVSTAGLKRGDVVPLPPGKYKVTGEMVDGNDSLLVIEPVKP